MAASKDRGTLLCAAVCVFCLIGTLVSQARAFFSLNGSRLSTTTLLADKSELEAHKG